MMHYRKIDDRSRVWVIERGPDGKLKEQLDPQLFAALNPGLSAEEIAEALVIAAGTAKVAETRAW